MSYLPPKASKTRELRERYKRRRRRQLGAVLGTLTLVLVALAALIGGIIMLRGCIARWQLSPRLPAGQSGSAKQPTVRLKEVGTRRFDLAPWFVDLDSKLLYTAADEQLREARYPSFPVDMLAAYPLIGGAALWERKLDAELSLFGAAPGRLILFNQLLSVPPRIEINTLNSADGSYAWPEVVLSGAEHGAAVVAGKIVLVAYWQKDGCRLAAYNIESGAKAWGLKAPLKGLNSEKYSVEPGLDLSLTVSGDTAAYSLYNLAGLVETNTGKLIKEFTVDGLISQVVIDDRGRLGYVLSYSSAGNSCLLQAVALTGGTLSGVCRIQALSADSVLLYANDGYVVLGYQKSSAADGATAIVSRIECYSRGKSAPILASELAGCVVQDIAVLPGAPGEFLMGTSTGLDDHGLPDGRGKLYRLAGPGGELKEVASFSRPLLYLAPFKQECLIMLRGGKILGYSAGQAKPRNVSKAAYDLFEVHEDNLGQRLAVISYPEDYATWSPGQKMQVLIFE